MKYDIFDNYDKIRYFVKKLSFDDKKNIVNSIFVDDLYDLNMNQLNNLVSFLYDVNGKIRYEFLLYLIDGHITSHVEFKTKLKPFLLNFAPDLNRMMFKIKK